MSGATKAEQDQFLRVMANELFRLAKTTPYPLRFLEESDHELRQAFTFLIVAQYPNSKTEILRMINEYFGDAKIMALQRLMGREAS